MFLAKKCQFFSLFKFGQNKTRDIAQRLCREERNLFYYNKKKEFFKVQIIVFFSKELIKKCQILFYLDLVKIRLEIMLSDFAEKKNLF